MGEFSCSMAGVRQNFRKLRPGIPEKRVEVSERSKISADRQNFFWRKMNLADDDTRARSGGNESNLRNAAWKLLKYFTIEERSRPNSSNLAGKRANNPYTFLYITMYVLIKWQKESDESELVLLFLHKIYIVIR